jgi:hypothetical protein
MTYFFEVVILSPAKDLLFSPRRTGESPLPRSRRWSSDFRHRTQTNRQIL